MYSEKLRKPNVLWRILPYGIVKWYAMHYQNENKEIVAQSYFFGRGNENNEFEKKGKFKRFNYLNLGFGMYYIVNPTGVQKARVSELETKLSELKSAIDEYDEFEIGKDSMRQLIDY